MQFSSDLSEIWPKTKNFFNEAYVSWTTPKAAPPSNRKYTVAFVPLLNNKGETVGCFVPELYELAKVNGLKNQDPSKTAFELAVLPVAYSDDNKTSANEIQIRVQDEFNHRIEHGKPLPQTQYKLVAKSDYLNSLHLIELKAGPARDVGINLFNPADKTTSVERAAHYVAQRAAFVSTLIAVLSLTPHQSILLRTATFLGAVLAKWCGEEFRTYGLAETLMRDIHSNFSKDFRWGDKISPMKTLKTAILLVAISAVATAAAIGGWTSIMALPILQPAPIIQYTLAGFTSIMAGLGSFVGGLGNVSYFHGLGIWDKHIDFSKEKMIGAQMNARLVGAQQELETLRPIAEPSMTLVARSPITRSMTKRSIAFKQPVTRSMVRNGISLH